MEIIKNTKDNNGIEVSSWTLQSKNTKDVININKVFEEYNIETISDCQWIDDEKKYIEVLYYNWDGSEFFAIINTKGYVLQVGIKEIQKYIIEFELFIVEVTGFGIGDEALYYNLQADDIKSAVIDFNGKFVIKPSYNSISFDDEKLVFNAQDSLNEFVFNVKGEVVN